MGSGRKPSQKSEIETALLEAACLHSNLIDDLEQIQKDIDRNEEQDHENDKTRLDAIGHLLKALESFSAKAYEDVDRHVHAAVQRLHAQEVQDLQDDKPRNEAKIKIATIRQRALCNKETIVKLIERLRHPVVVNVMHGVRS